MGLDALDVYHSADAAVIVFKPRIVQGFLLTCHMISAFLMKSSPVPDAFRPPVLAFSADLALWLPVPAAAQKKTFFPALAKQR